jgi:molecular chaperone Hsp33
MPGDTLYRLIVPSLNVRAYAAVTLDTARDITRVHNTTPNATAGLAKAISAAVLLSSSLKPGSDQSIGYKLQGSGPIAEIQVQVDAFGNVRGYTKKPRVDEEADLGSISFPKAIGAGLITVTKDLGSGDPYVGVSHLATGEIAMDTAYYLTMSEQIPSALVLALKLDHEGSIACSGGIMFQSFPDTPKDAIEKIEKGISGATVSLGDHLLGGGDILSYVSDITGGAQIDVLGETQLRHRCRCDKQLIRSVLKTLDPKDIEQMLHEDKGAKVVCTFCCSEHVFSKEDLESILEEHAR